MAVFEVGDHPAADRDIIGTSKLPYTGVKGDIDDATLATMMDLVKPHLLE